MTTERDGRSRQLAARGAALHPGGNRGVRRALRAAFTGTALGWMMLLSAGCADPVEPAAQDPAAQAEAEEKQRAASLAKRRKAASRLIDEGFSQAYEAYLASRLAPSSLRYLLLEDDHPVRLRRRAFLAQLYDARAWEPVFWSGGRPTHRGQAVLDVLERAGDHVLRRESYLTPKLEELLAARAEWEVVWSGRPVPFPDARQRSAIKALLERPEISSNEEPLVAALAQAFDSDGMVAGDLGDLRALHRARLEIERIVRGQDALIEALLADAMLAYAFDQKYANTLVLGPSATESERFAWTAERMTDTFRRMADSEDLATASALMDALWPHVPQYPKLLESRKRYASIVESGGWPVVPPASLGRGARGERVALLRRRLHVEGYLPTADGDVFDAELEGAIRAYQETHQLDVDGKVGRAFWTSLNIPADQRLAQIELTIQRWRESRIGDKPHYVFINIPDFHAEVWREGERQMRFRVVVGNTQRVCDPQTRTWKLPNATPIMEATMSYVVLNPYWNVPIRIVREELLPKLAADATYFERQGYEKVQIQGKDVVRQKPSPSNPLGVVKFMFPNSHSVYLHDTDKKQYFKYPIRSFSHGCMRVQEPLELLEYVLKTDGQWDERRVERIFESQIETSIVLKSPIPVIAEYYVVRVDDDGRTHFLADIYKYDRDRLSPPSAADLRCNPDPMPEYQMVLGDGGVVLYRGADGLTISADEYKQRLAEQQTSEGDPSAGDYGP